MTFDSSQVSLIKIILQTICFHCQWPSNLVRGEGSITLINDLSLDSVLVVPSLNYNLLSVSQITTVLFCIVIFWPNSCVFKEIQTRQTIGCGIKRGMLYYLNLTSNSSNKLRQALAVDGSQGEKKSSDIWLWHRRLRHVSFGYLKKLFLSYLKNMLLRALSVMFVNLQKAIVLHFH